MWKPPSRPWTFHSNLERLNTTKVMFDWTFARGLNYYTGTIFEISAPEQVSVENDRS